MSLNTETNPNAREPNTEPDWQKMNLAQLLPWIASQINRKNFNVLLILTVFFVYYNKSEQQIAEMDKKQEARNEELKQEFRDCNENRDKCQAEKDELVDFIRQYIIDSKKTP